MGKVFKLRGLSMLAQLPMRASDGPISILVNAEVDCAKFAARRGKYSGQTELVGDLRDRRDKGSEGRGT